MIAFNSDIVGCSGEFGVSLGFSRTQMFNALAKC